MRGRLTQKKFGARSLLPLLPIVQVELVPLMCTGSCLNARAWAGLQVTTAAQRHGVRPQRPARPWTSHPGWGVLPPEPGLPMNATQGSQFDAGPIEALIPAWCRATSSRPKGARPPERQASLPLKTARYNEDVAPARDELWGLLRLRREPAAALDACLQPLLPESACARIAMILRDHATA